MSGPRASFVPPRARFQLGCVTVTEKACRLDPAVLTESLHRHAHGDFGPIHDFRSASDPARRQGGDMTSAYFEPASESLFLVVTHATPRRTVILLPEEYGQAHP